MYLCSSDPHDIVIPQLPLFTGLPVNGEQRALITYMRTDSHQMSDDALICIYIYIYVHVYIFKYIYVG